MTIKAPREKQKGGNMKRTWEEKGTKAQSTKEPRVEKIIELWKKKSANVILKKKKIEIIQMKSHQKEDKKEEHLRKNGDIFRQPA